jgi:spore coat protein U-like protein
MQMNLKIAIFLVLAGFSTPLAAQAQSSHPSVSCALSSTPLDFGLYSPTARAPADFTATVTVTCTTGLSVPVAVVGTIALHGGSGGTAARWMPGGGAGLRYQLYTDPGRSVVWGDSAAGGATVAFTGSVRAGEVMRSVFTVHGRILARQSGSRAARYADLVTATLIY